MRSRLSSVLILGFFVALLFIVPVRGALPVQSDSDFDHGIIAYSKTAPTDPVARLQKRIDSGEVELKSESKLGYLPAILRELNVPISSQSAVNACSSRAAIRCLARPYATSATNFGARSGVPETSAGSRPYRSAIIAMDVGRQ